MLRFRILHVLLVVALVSLILVVLKQRQFIVKAQSENQSLRSALNFETTVVIEHGRYQLFRLTDGRILAVNIDAGDRSSIEGTRGGSLTYRWAMTRIDDAAEDAADALSRSFELLDNSESIATGGTGELVADSADRLLVGPLAINRYPRSANSGWLALSNTIGPAFFMYPDQPENLDELQLSPLRWRPIYWKELPFNRDDKVIENSGFEHGWGHFLEPANLIAEWEEEELIEVMSADKLENINMLE